MGNLCGGVEWASTFILAVCGCSGMSGLQLEELVTSLQAELGGGLQALATYDMEAYDVVFIRDDLAAVFSEDDIEAIWEYVAFDQMNTDLEEELYEKAHSGPYLGTLRVFGYSVIASFQFADHDDLYVAFDPRVDLSLSALLDLCADPGHW